MTLHLAQLAPLAVIIPFLGAALSLVLLRRNALQRKPLPKAASTTWTTTFRSDQYLLSLCKVSCAIQPMRPFGQRGVTKHRCIS
jgi:hypothetical protein